MRELIITSGDANQRLDKYLKKYMNKAGAGFLYKMLRKKNIKLNAKKATGNELLREGDRIALYLADDTIDSFREAIQLKKMDFPDVIYEDCHILLVNKPAGLLTQRAGTNDTSLVDQILYYLAKTDKYDPAAGKTKPSVCNRLDRNTSGLVMAGIDLAGLQFLSEVLKDRNVKKEYLCIVKGKMEALHIKGYLLKDEKSNKVEIFEKPVNGASFTETVFTPLSGNQNLSLMKAELITGKTHQIRSHLASAGHPIIGDTKYGDPQVNALYRKKYGITHQLLHAAYVTFSDYDGTFSYLTGKKYNAPIPKTFAACMKGEHLHE